MHEQVTPADLDRIERDLAFATDTWSLERLRVCAQEIPRLIAALREERTMVAAFQEQYEDALGGHLKVVDRAEKAEAERDALAAEKAEAAKFARLWVSLDAAHETVRLERDVAKVERDALQRHYDAAAPEHNLLALLEARELLRNALQARAEALGAITADEIDDRCFDNHDEPPDGALRRARRQQITTMLDYVRARFDEEASHGS